MWEQEMKAAGEAAEKAGKILLERFGKVTDITKKGEIDLVTEADLMSEKAILKIIGDKFPRDAVLAEETGEFGQNTERVWIIDPLDGTTNFAHSFPFFAISIALQVEDEVVLGLVYNPYLNEYFEARRGEGSFLNKKSVQVSQTKKLRESLLATGFPYSVYREPDGVMALFKKMLVLAQGIRRPGAAAIDLCYVASGRLDGFWEEDLKPWDTAAGSLIVKEAGGKVSDFNGEPYTSFQNSIVAANPFIHEEMLDVLNASMASSCIS